MTVKRCFSILLVLASLLALTGCSTESAPSSSTPSQEDIETMADEWEKSFGIFDAYLDFGEVTDANIPSITLRKKSGVCVLVKHMKLMTGQPYRLSAKVKLSETTLNEDYDIDVAPSLNGACISLSSPNAITNWNTDVSPEYSGVINDTEFKSVAFEFIPDQGNIDMALIVGGAFEGEAFFTEIKLERIIYEDAADFNIITIIYPTVDADIINYNYTTDERTFNRGYKKSMSQNDIDYYVDVAESLPETIEEYTAGRMTVPLNTVIVMDGPMTDEIILHHDDRTGSKNQYDFLGRTNYEHLKQIEGYIEGDYDQVILVAPIPGVNLGDIWYAGENGRSKNIGKAWIHTADGRRNVNIFLHEISHYLEANNVNPPPIYDGNTSPVHQAGRYGYGSMTGAEWLRDFMSNSISGYPNAGLSDENITQRRITSSRTIWQQDSYLSMWGKRLLVVDNR